MLTFDEGAEQPLMLHHRAFERAAGDAGWRARAGEVEVQELPRVEPLAAECEHFVSCVARGEQPRGAGRQAIDVMRVLDAGERSMRAAGAAVELL
jgi:predicted dehydrogenase